MSKVRIMITEEGVESVRLDAATREEEEIALAVFHQLRPWLQEVRQHFDKEKKPDA